MRMLIDVHDPIPAWVNQSYEPFGFYKFGVCCWIYNGYDGEIEWINTKHFCTEPKLTGVTAFRYQFQRGIVATVTPQIQVTVNVRDTIINAKPYNLVTGKNLPVLAPNI